MDKKEESSPKSKKKRSTSVSPKAMRFILLGVLVIAIALYGYLIYVYTDEQGTQSDLEEKIANSEPIRDQKRADREGKDPATLVEVAKEDLNALRLAFPLNKDSTDVSEILLKIAEENEVNILPLGSIKRATTQQIGENTYMVVSFGLNATGSLLHVLGFIDSLEDGSIETITLGDVTLSGSGDTWSARFTGKLYSRAYVSEPVAISDSTEDG